MDFEPSANSVLDSIRWLHQPKTQEPHRAGGTVYLPWEFEKDHGDLSYHQRNEGSSFSKGQWLFITSLWHAYFWKAQTHEKSLAHLSFLDMLGLSKTNSLLASATRILDVYQQLRGGKESEQSERLPEILVG